MANEINEKIDLNSEEAKESEELKDQSNVSEEESKDEKDKPSEDDELAKLKEDLAKREIENLELKSHIQRLQADFENFRRQSDKQKEDIVRFANEQLILKFVDVYEDMERVNENSTSDDQTISWSIAKAPLTITAKDKTIE